MRRSRVIWLGAGALACLTACGSSGASPPAGGKGGAGGAAGTTLAARDAGTRTDGQVDGAAVYSCPGPSDDGGTPACVQFDPGYPPPAACFAQPDAAAAIAPCPSEGAAGGCHASGPTGGYTVWWYAPLTASAVLTRCQQLGESYVSPFFDVTVDASAHAPQSDGG